FLCPIISQQKKDQDKQYIYRGIRDPYSFVHVTELAEHDLCITGCDRCSFPVHFLIHTVQPFKSPFSPLFINFHKSVRFTKQLIQVTIFFHKLPTPFSSV